MACAPQPEAKEIPGPRAPAVGPDPVLVTPASLRRYRLGIQHCPWSHFLTFGERRGRTVIVHRLDERGNLIQLGQQRRRWLHGLSLTPGVGTYYAAKITGPAGLLSERLVVHDGGVELYRVPRSMLRWKWKLKSGRSKSVPIEGEAVLADGTLLATYQVIWKGPLSPTVGPKFACLISRKGEYLVPPGVQEVISVLFSGDGSVVATYYRPDRTGESVPTHCTQLYSARDGKPLARFDGFWAQAISHDGRTLVGLVKDEVGEKLVVYRDGKRIAERPCNSVWGLDLSANGSYVYASTSDTEEPGVIVDRVFDAATLRPLYAIDRSADVVSSTGRLAVEHASCLTVYDGEGQPCSRQMLGPWWQFTGELAWSLDGETLYYLRGGVMRGGHLYRVAFQRQ